MKPYEIRRLTDSPDVGDCHSEGRPAHLFGKEHGGIKNKQSKAQARRLIKRADRAKAYRRAMREAE